MFRRLIEKIQIWFSLKNVKRQATISIIEEIKEAAIPVQQKEVPWFATANNIIDCFVDDGIVNYGTSNIKAVSSDLDDELPVTDPNDPILKHINELRAEWAEKNKVIKLEDFTKSQANDQEKEEVPDSVREGEVDKSKL